MAECSSEEGVAETSRGLLTELKYAYLKTYSRGCEDGFVFPTMYVHGWM